MNRPLNYIDASLGYKLKVKRAYRPEEGHIVLVVDHSMTRADIPQDPGSGPFIWMINTWLQLNGLLDVYSGEGVLYNERSKMLQPDTWEFHLKVQEPSDMEFFINNLQ